MTRFIIRELWTFPRNYWQVRPTRAIADSESHPSDQGFDGGEDVQQRWIGQRAPWGEALIGALPFLLFGLVNLLDGYFELAGIDQPALKLIDGSFLAGSADRSTIVLTLEMGVYLASLIGLVVGVWKSFPRWSYAYLGMALFLGWSYSSGRYFGVHYGLWAWLPLFAALFIGLALARSSQPLARLLQGVWNDWTRLSFALYAFPLMLTVGFFDDEWGVFQLYGLAFDTVVMSAGAVAYLRTRTILGRMLSLQVSVLIVVVKGFLGGWFWPAIFVIIILFNGFLLLPGLIGLFRRGVAVLSPE